jgi:hypothetical protein
MTTTDRRIGGGWLEYGCMDLYPGQQLTWTLVGRLDLERLAGKTIGTMNGWYVVPAAPPPPGPREVDGGLI